MPEIPIPFNRNATCHMSPVISCLPHPRNMTTLELSPTSLPLKPPPYDEWKGNWPNHLRAYDLAFNAERHADKRLKVDPSNQEAKDHLMFARVAGYLLLEFFNRRAILSDIPCESLAKRLISPPQDGDTPPDIVFRVGKWYFDRLLCRGAFGFFPTSFWISDCLQFGHPLTPRRTLHRSPYVIQPPPSTR